ncbi:hydroxylysine kinase isoform X1 [Lontra canadensis]|uniref:hydroxylysine kinase isoform X1 n=2 Tax=Lontra canadensis TaxID=76717 RepID=UPI0013F34241|nr:hydroxylysine kinase isoform X1 [Lontra canadensis]
MSHGDDQQSQALAKPTFSDVQASALVQSVFGLKVSKIRPLPSYDDQNFHVCISSAKDTADEPTEYVLKISNTESSRSPELIEVQSHVSMFLRAAGFPTASVHPTAGGHLSSLVSVDGGSGVAGYLLRLLSYLPGTPVAEIPSSPQLLYEVGRLAGRLDETLQKFHHPKLSHLRRENFIWNLKNVPLLEKYLDALGQSQNREIVIQVIQLFKDEILTKLRHFRECKIGFDSTSGLLITAEWRCPRNRKRAEKELGNFMFARGLIFLLVGVNHGDLNDHNILVEPSKSAFGDAVYHVSGILDFGDMSYGYYVFEVAITIMYMMIESKSPLHVGGHVLAGFESVIPLTPVERSALFLLVCGRFCQSLVIAAHSCQLHPENKDYLMITAKTGWKRLQEMLDMGQKAVEEIWFETARSYDSGVSM